MAAQGRWLWITERPKPDPQLDWQSREPVTPEMKEFVCAAWRAYDNSDARFEGITHDEAVLANFAVTALSRAKMNADYYKQRYAEVLERERVLLRKLVKSE